MIRVILSEERLPGPRERLLVRRSLDQEPELKYHRSNAPPEVPLTKVAQVRATRWTIEKDIKRPRDSAAWMSTKREAGSVGTTIRPSYCWPWDSWYSREYEW